MHKYIETISCIELKVIGHAPGLAFLSVVSLGLGPSIASVRFTWASCSSLSDSGTSSYVPSARVVESI